MKRNSIRIFALAAALTCLWICAPGVSAQQTTSPYSKFGYGLLRDNATSAQRQMGGVGYAMNSGRQINVMNPASYAMIDTLTFLFDTGVSLSNVWTEDRDVHRNSTGGGLDYITMQVPIGRRMGASLGLVPYSSVGYSFGSDIDNGTSSRTGEGGLNQLYLGFSGKVLKNFSLGFNVSYLFGTTYNNVNAISNLGTTTIFTQETEVRDFHFEFGAQYSLRLNADNRLTAGLVFSPGKTLLGHTMVTTAEYDANTASNVVVDTVARVSLKDRFSLPCTWGAGLNWQWRNRLMLEADFTYQPWASAKFPKLDNFISTRFQDRWKIALGAQYTHNPRGNYLQRIAFRAGAFYSRDYITVNNNSVRDWGVSLGFGLPAPGQKTMINLGVEYRKRQAHPNPMLKESYLNVTLGVNFNETWFWKNKIR